MFALAAKRVLPVPGRGFADLGGVRFASSVPGWETGKTLCLSDD